MKLYDEVLTDEVIAEIQRQANIAFNVTTKKWLGGEHSGKGVYFRAAFFKQSPSGEVPYQFLEDWVSGEANRDGEVRYRANSAEKMSRLHQHRPQGHISASQSVEEGMNFRGAIAVKVHLPAIHLTETEYELLVLSASGIPDQGDEAGLIHLADMIGELKTLPWRISIQELKALHRITGNTVYAGRLPGIGNL